MFDLENIKICIIGLGYVGLPLAVEFGKRRKTLGFDINEKRIKDLRNGIDKTLENSKEEISEAVHLKFTSFERDLYEFNCYILTVPTPIDKFNNPDLNPIKNATKQVGKYLKKDDLVIYESTVYPGCTEEVCVPILEKESKLNFNRDFFCGYSPERINPGDKNHKITDIKKITSGSTEYISDVVNNLYKEIIPAGTHKAKSIKIAEAAKIIENTQRDLNIALINELSMFFSELDIDTESVLKAAETKWNFNSYRPGLVGGHCISVDPYYLTHKAKQINFKPEIILSGRKINDNMPNYIAKKLIQCMKTKNINIENSKILIMGLSFKENCNDIRNTQVINLYRNLINKSSKVDIYDPMIKEKDVHSMYNIKLINIPNKDFYDAIIIAVAHNIFRDLGLKKIKSFCKEKSIIYDLKYLLKEEDSDLRL